jgi:hypothetical protein
MEHQCLQHPVSNPSDGCSDCAPTIAHTHPKSCVENECMLCGMRDCPRNEPFHYHHDGCPYCFQ